MEGYRVCGESGEDKVHITCNSMFNYFYLYSANSRTSFENRSVLNSNLSQEI
jgi:hypothetical protein